MSDSVNHRSSATVLVASGDPFELRMLQELCEAAHYVVLNSVDGPSVLDTVARKRPDLLLLDSNLDAMSGLEVLQILKEDTNLADIPIVLIAPGDDEQAQQRALELGAMDCIARPFRVFEVQQRIKNALRLHRAEMRASVIPGASSVDPLTHTGTSQQLLITLDYEFTRASRYSHALSLIVVEISNFEEFTGAHGSDMADGAIVELASSLRKCIRSIDHIFRIDDARFALLLPETDASGARTVLDRIDENAHVGEFWSPGTAPEPKLDVGSSSFPGKHIGTAKELYEHALPSS